MIGKEKRWAGLKQAQRRFAVTKCQMCGGTMTLQGHHIDRNPLNNSPENIRILCQNCHKVEHMQKGDWGKGAVPKRRCQICGKEFQPKRQRRGTLCGDPECLRKKGRLSAERRWG